MRNREKGHRERKSGGDTGRERKGEKKRRKGDGEEAHLLAGDLWLWASEINLVNIAKLLRQGLTI